MGNEQSSQNVYYDAVVPIPKTVQEFAELSDENMRKCLLMFAHIYDEDRKVKEKCRTFSDSYPVEAIIQCRKYTVVVKNPVRELKYLISIYNKYLDEDKPVERNMRLRASYFGHYYYRYLYLSENFSLNDIVLLDRKRLIGKPFTHAQEERFYSLFSAIDIEGRGEINFTDLEYYIGESNESIAKALLIKSFFFLTPQVHPLRLKVDEFIYSIEILCLMTESDLIRLAFEFLRTDFRESDNTEFINIDKLTARFRELREPELGKSYYNACLVKELKLFMLNYKPYLRLQQLTKGLEFVDFKRSVTNSPSVLFPLVYLQNYFRQLTIGKANWLLRRNEVQMELMDLYVNNKQRVQQQKEDINKKDISLYMKTSKFYPEIEKPKEEKKKMKLEDIPLELLSEVDVLDRIKFSYSEYKYKFYVGERIDPITPETNCEKGTFLCEPSLPDGLLLNIQTGVISGTPVQIQPSIKYKVVMKYHKEYYPYEFQIKVKGAPPSDFRYVPSKAEFIFNHVITPLKPNYKGHADSFSISPKELPAGLYFNEKTGVLSGTPQLSPTRTYIVQAKNIFGFVVTSLTISVVRSTNDELDKFEHGIQTKTLLPVIKYDRKVYMIEQEAEMKPIVPYVLNCHEFEITPRLCEGLYLNQDSGEILGRPMMSVDNVKYTITGRNTFGESSTEINLYVCGALAPKDLKYPQTSYSFYLDAKVDNIVPTVTYPVLEYLLVPGLPKGLTFNSETGEISGVAEETMTKTVLTIRASNPFGSDTTQISFEVLEPPYAIRLKYPQDEYRLPLYYGVKEIKPSYLGNVDQFVIEPEISNGLKFNPNTGIFSGRTSLSGEYHYTITALCKKGRCETKITFFVDTAVAATMLKYGGDKFTFFVNKDITPLKPQIDHTASVYTISPPLPDGLEMDSFSGIISGKPMAEKEEAVYNISASNSVGVIKCSLSIEIVTPKPHNIVYPHKEYTFYLNMNIEEDIVPELENGADAFVISPLLPNGIEIDPKNGTISGIPQQLSNKTKYIVEAANESGKGTCELFIEVVEVPVPQKLQYPKSKYTLFSDEEIEPIKPEVINNPTVYKIEPELDDGLEFNEETGVFTGAPRKHDIQQYVVTATNEYGSCCTNISITVVDKTQPLTGLAKTIPLTLMDVKEVITIVNNQPAIKDNLPENSIFFSPKYRTPLIDLHGRHVTSRGKGKSTHAVNQYVCLHKELKDEVIGVKYKLIRGRNLISFGAALLPIIDSHPPTSDNLFVYRGSTGIAYRCGMGVMRKMPKLEVGKTVEILYDMTRKVMCITIGDMNFDSFITDLPVGGIYPVIVFEDTEEQEIELVDVYTL